MLPSMSTSSGKSLEKQKRIQLSFKMLKLGSKTKHLMGTLSLHVWKMYREMTLGTGSSQPSKHRNVSSIYLNHFLKGARLWGRHHSTTEKKAAS